MTNQNCVVAALACHEANFAFKYCSRLGSFRGADVDAVVVYRDFRLRRMRTQTVFAGDDALLNRIRQLAFVLGEVVREIVID